MKGPNKYYTHIFCLILLIALSACSKENEEPKNELPWNWGWDYWGEITAQLNGQDWEAKIYGHHNSPATNIGFSISVDYFIDELGPRRGSLSMFRIPFEVGKHRAIKSFAQDSFNLPGASYLTILQDGDVWGDGFDLIDSLDNYIELTDIQGDEVWGRFQFTMLRELEDPNAMPVSTDTIRFTNGYFHTRLHEPE